MKDVTYKGIVKNTEWSCVMAAKTTADNQNYKITLHIVGCVIIRCLLYYKPCNMEDSETMKVLFIDCIPLSA